MDYVMSAKVAGICDTCGALCERNERWDAYFCRPCDQWMEAACVPDDNEPYRGCYFSCWDRPPTPLAASSDE
jgi:hypothetical protein